MPMTKAELLKKHPLPWRVECHKYTHAIWNVYDANDVWMYAFDDGAQPRLIVACVNAMGQYANPAAAGECLEILQILYGAGNPPSKHTDTALDIRARAALAAPHQAPEQEDET